MISSARDRVAVVLDFDVGASRYRIARTLRRSGAQMVRLEQRDAGGSFKSLADQVRAVNDRVTQILGLGAPAFTQAVVLPQGEFARFLKAQPRDRRSMLRTLLRLDVYERMRERAQRLAATRKLRRRRAAASSWPTSTPASTRPPSPGSRRSTPGSSRRSRRRGRNGTTPRPCSSGCATSTPGPVELRQAEERRAALARQAEQVSLAKERLAAAARAVPLLPLLEEAARAARRRADRGAGGG